MITLTDFQKYETLEQELKAFLIDRIKDYNDVKYFDAEEFYKDEDLERDFEWWEIESYNMKIIFENRRCEGNYYYLLPLDCLFSPDFKTIMKQRFQEEREKQRLALIEKRKQREKELEQLAEKKKLEEIEELKRLMGKYPKVVEGEQL